MHFEKEDKGSLQENTAFDDSDPIDSQTVFAWLMVNGSFLLLKCQNESGEEKKPSPFCQYS